MSKQWPYSVVWTPLPIITWLIPIIGHVGITDSEGIIYDFSGDYQVSVDDLAFGAPTKYYRLPNLDSSMAEQWDKAIRESSDHYVQTRHNIFSNNCHRYVACVLNKIKYQGKGDWTQIDVWWKITFRSKYVDLSGFFRQWLPFSIISTVLIIVLCATKL